MPHRLRLIRLHAFATLLITGITFAPFARAQAPAARTPHEVIGALGVEVRQLLATPRADRKRADAERDAAAQVSALAASTPGHLQLTAADGQGRTPLMLAVSGGHLPVVQALLADASVRLQINASDERGVSAWMLANFVPGVSLVACEPGALTIERAPLLVPYVRRMVDLLGEGGAQLTGIMQALQQAGAEARPDAARSAWLAQCPNAEPSLREALQSGPLMPTLITHSVRRQVEFNRDMAGNRRRLEDRPPETMRFNGGPNDSAQLFPLLKLDGMNCLAMPKPSLGKTIIRWQGTMLFRAIASTRAGVIETVDLDLLPSSDEHTPDVLHYFRAVIIQALAGSECLGDHVFEQEFQFRID